MVWFVIALIFSALLDLVNLHRQSDREKDLEILILRTNSISWTVNRPPIKISKAEKLALSVLTNKLKTVSSGTVGQLRNVLRIFQPETVLKWHRELVRRKWMQKHKHNGGVPGSIKSLKI